MSVSTEVQRTLVKSPPELWSELSNPDALARHLSELGEIRITAVEPETKVEWEAEGASGVVQLKQSGWGTKVTLSVTRSAATIAGPPEPATITGPADAETEPAAPGAEPAAIEAEIEPVALTEPTPEPAAVEPEPGPEPEPTTIEPKPTAIEAEPEPSAVSEDVVATVETESESSPVVAEHQTGFFARLFRRGRGKRRVLAEALADFDAVTPPEPQLEIVALAAPEPTYPEPTIEPEPEVTEPDNDLAAEPASDLAAELASVEAQMTAETTELLTGVLDRLGAAHHRPFSRG